MLGSPVQFPGKDNCCVTARCTMWVIAQAHLQDVVECRTWARTRLVARHNSTKSSDNKLPRMAERDCRQSMTRLREMSSLA